MAVGEWQILSTCTASLDQSTGCTFRLNILRPVVLHECVSTLFFVLHKEISQVTKVAYIITLNKTGTCNDSILTISSCKTIGVKLLFNTRVGKYITTIA